MPKATAIDNDKFPRVNTRITREALDRLNYAREVLERFEPRICPQGQIITELIMDHLDPSPSEKLAVEKITPQALVAKPKKKKPPKTEKRAASAPKTDVSA
jgi:hypothetical protein